MSNHADAVVSEYMHRLEWRLAALPQDRREEILAEVREHIDESLASGEDAGAVIEQLGDPAQIAEEAAPLRFGTSLQQSDGAGDKYMRRYIRRLRRRLRLVPADKREEILADMQRRIDASLPEDGSATRKDAEALAERLGYPDDIARDAVERFGIQVDKRFVALCLATTAASGLFIYFAGTVSIDILPFMVVLAYGMFIRSASQRAQVAIYLLAAGLTVLIGWVESGSVVSSIIDCVIFATVLLIFEAYERSKPASRSADVAVKKYMRRLRRRLRPLPREQREEILAGVREHIDESLPKDGSATREDAQTLIERLGGSAEIADDAAQRFGETGH
jgi:uncharacterized membrane protein